MWKNSLRKASTMNSMQNSNVIAAAVGATIGVVSVAAVFIYHKVMEKQQQAQMTNNIDRVNRKVVELQAELAELRNQQLNLQKSRRKRAVRKTPPSNDNTFTLTDDIDSYSIADTDVGDEEFFDCSDSEGDLELGDNGTSQAITELSKDEPMFKQIDRDLDDRSLQLSVYPKLKALLRAEPENVEVVWRFARVCYYCSEHATDKEAKKDFINEGTEACEKVLEVQSGGLYKWYAILVGIKSGLLGTKERIQIGYIFKKYVEKALEILPRDSYLHHLLGRFKYEVSKLTWLERKVAATLFAEVPKSSYEEALQHFEQSENLGVKPFYENKLYLSKCYFALGQNSKGIEWLRQIIEPLEGTNEEEKVRNEAKKLLAKYS